jgi:hypothetical protein
MTELLHVRKTGEMPSPPPSLAEAAKLMADAEDRIHEINLLEAEALAKVADQVVSLREEAESLNYRADQILAECVAAGHLEEGHIRIRIKARTTRTVNVERFRQAFPEEFAHLAMVPVQKAEALIGKARLDPYCDLIRGPETYEIAFNFKGARR